MLARSNLLTMVAALLLAFALAGPATAHNGKSADARAQLRPVAHQGNVDGGSHSTATVRVLHHADGPIQVGDELTLVVDAKNVSPNLPHAQHIHGESDRCPLPTARDDRDDDGLISTLEGVPFYGDIEVSLTTSGDTSPASKLAVSRFPVAEPDGTYHYERVFTVVDEFTDGGDAEIPLEVASDLEEYEVVIHGIAETELGDDTDVYDGPPSPLTSAVPFEATVPTACGGFHTTG